MKTVFIPQKDRNKWSNCINPNLAGYPFYTSVYYLCPRSKPNRYYGRFDCYLHFFRQGIMDTYQPKAGFEEAGKVVIRECLRGNKKYHRILKRLFVRQRQALKLCQRHIEEDNAAWLKDWPRLQLILADASNYVYTLDRGLDMYFGQLAVDNPNDHQRLQTAMKPLYPSFIDEANKILLQLLKKYPDNFDLVHRKFVERFGWFQNSYQGKFELSKPWLKAYAKSISRQPKSISSNKKIAVPKKYRLLIAVGRLGVNYRDDKKKLLQLMVELMDRWLKIYARDKKMDYKVLRWLAYDEISRLTPEIYRRASGYERSRKRCVVLDAKGFHDVPKNFFDWVAGLNKNEPGSEIAGIGASPGKATGKVKIILDLRSDSKKLKRGDILVTSMTRPEYLPLMKIASAFVTNEGGLTCHAAIVAREMGKPCIIGTINATKVFRDGDRVEADGDKGLVRKI